MKRVLSIVGVLAAVIVTVAIVGGVLMYTGVFSKDDVLQEPVSIYDSQDGRKYTEARWDWVPQESKKIISYVNDTSSISKVTVALAVDNYTFYDITIPNVPYVYDFGKTVWAKDGSFMIRVIGQANMNTLSALAGIDNGENINQYTLKTPDGVKGSRTIATLVGDTAIVVNVYSGDKTYSILRDSIANNRETYTISEVPYSDWCKYIDAIVYSGSYMPTVVVQDVSLQQNRYMFEDGMLWQQTVVQSFDDTCNIYLSKMVVASESGMVEVEYNDGKKLYAESGSYCVGVISYNTNTSIALIGNGEEARCNIVSVLSNF